MSLLMRSVSRLASSVPKRSLAVSSSLRGDLQMPDPLEHATGLEKYELLAKEAGNEDPFFLKAVQRAKVKKKTFRKYFQLVNMLQGTKDAPTIVHAMDNYRMVGCVCNEEDTNIKWTWLCEVRNFLKFNFFILNFVLFHQGVPKRCECGYWMQLKVHPAPEKYHLPL